MINKNIFLFALIFIFFNNIFFVNGSEAEWKKHKALIDGYEVIQVTSKPGYDCKLYYTTNPYIQLKNWLVFASDRTRAENLFYIDLKTGIINQITNATGKNINAPHAVVCAETLEIFYLDDNTVKSINIETKIEKNIYTFDKTKIKVQGSISISTDGKVVAFPMQTKTTPVKSHIVVLNSNGTNLKEITPIEAEINHVYIRPKNPDQIMYMVVDNGMWLVKINGDNNRRIRADSDTENVSHPFWTTDGSSAVFFIKSKEGEFFGKVNPDNDIQSGLIELYPSSNHFNINPSQTMLVGDGHKKSIKGIFLYPINNDKKISGKLIFYHNSSFEKQVFHPHPTFINETDVVFNSDMGGDGNIYLLRKLP